jgi:uncharacterized protein YkwD
MGLLFVAALFVSLATSPAEVATGQLGGDEESLLELINAHRADNGLSALDFSSTLTDVAAWMSRDMAEKDYFSHTDSLGRDPFQRMADFGYNYNTWKGENLAAGSDTPQMTFQLWRDSPGHNANMLNSNFVVVGLAKAYGSGSTYGWYWAAEFGGYDDGGGPPPTPEPSPTSTPEPTPTAEPTPPGADLGLAPPTRDTGAVDGTSEPAPVVRELAPGWNQFQCPPGPMRLTEVLPVENGKLMAIYAWDGDGETWRRYLPGIDIPRLNTLTELTDQQAVWILASERFSLTLPT